MEKKRLTFILFGGTGDLTRRKLVPAFSKLVKEKKLNKNSTIIGISRKKMDDLTYKKFLFKDISDNSQRNKMMSLKIKYLQGDFSLNCIRGLKKILNSCEIGECNRIFYLATSFKFFPKIVKEIKSENLHKQKNGFTRIVFEKPFGKDNKSSIELDKKIHSVFPEREVYRIDHYLAKETVQNLNILKFTNPFLYGTFNKDYIESIEIDVNERLGVGNRINYYNEAGAIKDMVQNHLLQVLSILLMQSPKSFDAEDIHDEKVRMLKKIEPLTFNHHVLGQYESYMDELKESGINLRQHTETFAMIMLKCNAKQWKGTDLILRTGKKLNKKYGKIKIRFKSSRIKISSDSTIIPNNEIIINIYPKQDISLFMNTTEPNKLNKLKTVKFNFCSECEFGPNTAEEYSILLNEIIKGDKTLFTREDELRESWKIIDKIEKMKNKIKFIKYADCENPDNILTNN